MRKAPYPIPAQTRPAESPRNGAACGQHALLWRILDDLSLCRADYDLTPSSLSVLRALISFLPKTDANPTGQLIVWPSNHALCDRAGGMDERTLRRHLARLCAAGLIQRQSSPNGKRFALRIRKAVVTAYGFCLTPLLALQGDIEAAAASRQAMMEQVAQIRTEILSLLHRLRTEVVDNTALLTTAQELEIRRMLRRVPDIRSLGQARDHLVEVLGTTTVETPDLTATDGQIDRHQQNTKKESFDSVCDTPPTSPVDNLARAKEPRNEAHEDITLADCLEAASESIAFTTEPVRNWADLMRLADTLAPMIGISPDLMDHSRRAMGPLPSAISILCLIQRSAHIHKPAAYLRKLAMLADQGLYSLKSLVRSAQRQRFAAAN